MRIIAGEFRGRRLRTQPGRAVRPTSDRLRETLFSVLRNEVPGAVFVDCYAGSGAVGLEALSRGAAEVIFIERDDGAIRTIEQNLAALQPLAGTTGAARVVHAEAKAGLRRLAARGLRAS
ncbi:MAG TPA: RsmD family RNA methyltransferase, partial [Terriglobia bacterium]|nr:RsmD family RNA methyltransferase [Terriglobia bacterium]